MRLLFGDNLAIEASFFAPLNATAQHPKSCATLFGDHIMHSVITHSSAYNIAGLAGDRGGLENRLDMIGTDGRYARCRIGRG